MPVHERAACVVKDTGLKYQLILAGEKDERFDVKLIVQIPCYNEELTLPQTVHDLPRTLPGIDEIELLIVDDGSTDQTVAVARSLGIRHIICHKQNRGLAAAFASGLTAALAAGADIIVNTDADNQYCGADVAALVEPILAGRADIVVGDRGVALSQHMSPVKRALQRAGSWVVQQTAGIPVPDATSGFRAFSREAALRLTVLSDYTYTLETLIHAGARRMAVCFVPIHTNECTRGSRLIRNIPSFLSISAISIVRFYTMYRPLRVFITLGSVMLAMGVLLCLRFLYLFLMTGGNYAGHVQSLILASILIVVGVLICLIGLLADLVQMNRKLLEETLLHARRMDAERGIIETGTRDAVEH
jgi:glycosyltransferase involved in cell wall biosynthesis